MAHQFLPAPQDLSEDPLLLKASRDVNNRPTLGGIALLAKLGQGGMGAVYFAMHPRLQVEIAVKVLPFHLAETQQDTIKRFLSEAHLAAKAKSAHVVNVMDLHEEGGLYYIVMEFVPGYSGSGLLKKYAAGIVIPPLPPVTPGSPVTGLPEKAALAIAIAGTTGLETAHKLNIVHRDIKPDNIMIPCADPKVPDSPLEFTRAKLADLGLAKPQENAASVTAADMAMGTPGFMSYEQLKDFKTTGKPADVFSMGATLYALLTGRPPYDGATTNEKLFKTMEHSLPPVESLRPDLSPATIELLARCLQQAPDQRFADASELLHALRAAETALLKSAKRKGTARQNPASRKAPTAKVDPVAVPAAGNAAESLPAKRKSGTNRQTPTAAAAASTAAPARKTGKATAVPPAAEKMEQPAAPAGPRKGLLIGAAALGGLLLLLIAGYFLVAGGNSTSLAKPKNDLAAILEQARQHETAARQAQSPAAATAAWQTVMEDYQQALKIQADDPMAKAGLQAATTRWSEASRQIGNASSFDHFVADAKKRESLAEAEPDPTKSAVLWQQAVDAYDQALHLNPNHEITRVAQNTARERTADAARRAQDLKGAIARARKEATDAAAAINLEAAHPHLQASADAWQAAATIFPLDLSMQAEATRVQTAAEYANAMLQGTAKQQEAEKEPVQTAAQLLFVEAASGFEKALLAKPGDRAAQQALNSVQAKVLGYVEIQKTYSAEIARARQCAADAHTATSLAQAETLEKTAIAAYQAALQAKPGDTAAQDELATLQFRKRQTLYTGWGEIRRWKIKDKDAVVNPQETVLAVSTSNPGGIQLWNFDTGKPDFTPLKTIPSKAGIPTALTFSSDGAYLAGCFREDKSVRVWEVATGTEVAKLIGHAESPLCAAFSSDNRTLLSAGDDKSARSWDWRAERESVLFTGHGETSRTVTTPDFDKMRTTPPPFPGAPAPMITRTIVNRSVYAANFSPDGKQVVTASVDGVVHVSNAITGALTLKLEGHTGPVRSACFSPDGTIILTASEDRTARLWDTATGKELQKFDLHANPLVGAIFGPDGCIFTLTRYDCRLHLWDIATGKQIRQVELSTSTGAIPDRFGWLPHHQLVTIVLNKEVIFWGDPKINHPSAVSSAPAPEATDPADTTPKGTEIQIPAPAPSPDNATPTAPLTCWGVIEKIEISTSIIMDQGGSMSKIDARSGKQFLTVHFPACKKIDLYDSGNFNLKLPGSAFAKNPPLGVSFAGNRFQPVSSAAGVSGTRLTPILLFEIPASLKTCQLYCKEVAVNLDIVNRKITASEANPDLTARNSGTATPPIPQPTTPPPPTTAAPPAWGTISRVEILTTHGSGPTMIRPTAGYKLVELSILLAPGANVSKIATDCRMNATGSKESIGCSSFPLFNHPPAPAVFIFSVPTNWGKCSLQCLGETVDLDLSARKVLTPGAAANTSEPPVPAPAPSSPATAIPPPPPPPIAPPPAADSPFAAFKELRTLGELAGHQQGILAVAINPADPRWAVSAGRDKAVILWDLSTGKMQGQPRTEHTKEVRTLAFSPDGQRIASGSGDCTVLVWDAALTVKAPLKLAGPASAVYSVAFSGDSLFLAAASGDRTARIWDLKTAQEIVCMDDFTDPVRATAFQPGTGALATGSEDKSARLWDIQGQEPRELRPFTGHEKSVLALAFSPDGKTIATASADTTVRIHAVETGKLRAVCTGHTAAINAVAFSRDGQFLVSASSDNSVRVWNAQTGQLLKILAGHADAVQAVVFTADGRQILSAGEDHLIKLWSAPTPEK